MRTCRACPLVRARAWQFQSVQVSEFHKTARRMCNHRATRARGKRKRTAVLRMTGFHTRTRMVENQRTRLSQRNALYANVTTQPRTLGDPVNCKQINRTNEPNEKQLRVGHNGGLETGELRGSAQKKKACTARAERAESGCSSTHQDAASIADDRGVCSSAHNAEDRSVSENAVRK